MNPVFEALPTSIFEIMSLAAAEHGAVNLGQGFPDFGWPEPLLDEATRLIGSGSNQYAPSRGLPALREAICAHYGRHHGARLSPDQVLVTSGATEAIAAVILALVSPGDEVIVITPAYDAYAPMVRRAGGTVVEVALQPPGWILDPSALEAAVTKRTKLLILNNPHNPTGRLFSRAELQAVADIAQRHDLLVLSDEVWEHVILPPTSSLPLQGEVAAKPTEGAGRVESPPQSLRASSPQRGATTHFIPFASLPDMASRTLKTGSAGKIFALTGWKIGWLVAPPELASAVARAHQFLTFATATPLQAAVAWGLDHGDAWLPPMQAAFARGRDRLCDGLASHGFVLLPSQATYFACLDLKASGIDLDDRAFATRAVERAGIAVIPLSPFAETDPPTHFVRLCFAKRDSTLDAGIAAMARARG
jgi:N-succinyldiaminopimelate aminotransferase